MKILLSKYLYYNCPISDIDLHDMNICLPLSKTHFLRKLESLKNDPKPMPPTFYIVNASDNEGTHWYVVVLHIPRSTHRHEE